MREAAGGMAAPAVEARGLRKAYGRRGEVVALGGLDLTVAAGSVYGLLGPNGAGKTTLMTLALGQARPDAGSLSVLGRKVRFDDVALRRDVALVPETKALYGGMRVDAFVRWYAAYFPEAEPERALAQLSAWGIDGGRRTDGLSRGSAARVLLAAVLARRPRLLLLDEPTDGLDPEGTESLLEALVDRAATGDATIVVASHRLEEVERVCDRVGLISGGRLLLEGELDALREGAGGATLREIYMSAVRREGDRREAEG